MDHQSYHNHYVKKLRKILEKPREHPDVCLVEGLRACELFASSSIYELEQWFMVRKIYDELPVFVDREYLTIISEEAMKMLSRATTPSGLLGFFKRKPLKEKDFAYPTFVLQGISDPGNVGTIIRTAAALGRKSIIMIGGSYHHSYKVVQASAGTLAHVKVIRVTWEEFLEKRDVQIPLYGLDMHGAPLESFSSESLSQCYLLVGNEAHGISEEVKRAIDSLISLPMNPLCESLNAAVAASIAGYRAWSKK